MKTKRLNLIALRAFFAGNLVAAPIGTAFTYQGRLASGGSAANGLYDFQFTVYDALSSGSLVAGSLTNAATGVTNGLFTVTIDFGEEVFEGGASWLEIGVRTNGSAGGFTTLSPRQPLTPLPYALYAPNAGFAKAATSVSGPVAASQLTGTISSNQIAPASITATMLAAGSVTSSKLATGAVTATKLAFGAVTTSALQDGAVTAEKVAATTTVTLLTTFTNPTPAADDYFGYSLAVVGNDRVLIGAYRDNTGAAYAGAAYLFSTDGVLLTTFTNPTPAANDLFGYAVAAVGSDRVLIGALNGNTGAGSTGAAYLFSTNGTLLTTFTNPTPEVGDSFGCSVAAVGSDRVLIGAYADNTGAAAAGAAYLFSTNGTLLTTFTNPTPATGNVFGYSVTAVGNDRVLISALRDDTGAVDAGAAYLFNINGALLTTFTNPTPATEDFFGISVAAVGSDRVLIGAMNDNAGGVSAGAAYLFQTNGTLLATFTNPIPTDGVFLGCSVAAVGNDRVLIGAFGYDVAGLGAWDAGAAYLFRTNGTWLATITKPTPVGNDNFGRTVAAVGHNQVLIGALHDDTGATDAVASSADGSKLVAVLEYGQIYTSTDSGVNWTARESTRYWTAVASSADGTKLVAVVFGGQIYTSETTPVTFSSTTTPGSAGSLDGEEGTAIELQYIGNNLFLPLSHEGSVFAY